MYRINLAHIHHLIGPIILTVILTSTKRLAVLFCDICLFPFLAGW